MATPFIDLFKTPNSSSVDTNVLRGFPGATKTPSAGFEASSTSNAVSPPFQGQADFNMNQELINLIYPGKAQSDPRFSATIQMMWQHLMKTMKPDEALQVLLKMGTGGVGQVNRLFGQNESEAAKAYMTSKNMFLASEQERLQKQTLDALNAAYNQPNQKVG